MYNRQLEYYLMSFNLYVNILTQTSNDSSSGPSSILDEVEESESSFSPFNSISSYSSSDSESSSMSSWTPLNSLSEDKYDIIVMTNDML